MSEELEKVVIESEGDKYFQVGAQLPFVDKEELISFLKSNVDVFAWNTYEASRIDLEFMCHHLNINPSVVPRRQPPPPQMLFKGAC